MPTTIVNVQTAQASRYLQQLCKHWSHKFAVVFDPSRGTVPLPGARLDLTAEPDVLRLRLEGENEADVERLRDVVAQHISRFAFREELAFDWRRTD